MLTLSIRPPEPMGNILNALSDVALDLTSCVCSVAKARHAAGYLSTHGAMHASNNGEAPLI